MGTRAAIKIQIKSKLRITSEAQETKTSRNVQDKWHEHSTEARDGGGGGGWWKRDSMHAGMPHAPEAEQNVLNA